MLRLANEAYLRMVGHCYDGLPLEACGLLGGDPETGKAAIAYPCRNEARSAKLYSIGLDYTHTAAYPSPTDVDQAPDPSWHYVLVSLKDNVPVVRSYRIVDGNISEEPVVLERR
jgi:hypothetical protein